MRQLQVSIPTALYERVRAASALNHKPMSWFVERAIRHVQKHPEKYGISLPDA
jgi:hypothetical protein